eukprot:gene9958-18568_t
MAHMVAARGNLFHHDFFAPFEGRVAGSTQENIENATSGSLILSFLWLDNNNACDIAYLQAIDLQNEVGVCDNFANVDLSSPGVCHDFTCNDHFSTKKNAVNGSGEEQERKVGSNVEINDEADSLDFAGESDTEELISNENSSPTLKRVTFNLICSPIKSRKRI